MAGNWKMNLDHLEANHLIQGLAVELKENDHDYSKCEVVVFPPFTDIRSVQTVVEADELGIKYGAQDVSTHDNGAYTGENLHRHANQARLHLRANGPLRAS